MPTTTVYEFGDVVLVPFPFTDLTGSKQRPAVVVSSARYHDKRPDLVIMAVTSQVRSPGIVGDMAIARWREAGLLKSLWQKAVGGATESPWVEAYVTPTYAKGPLKFPCNLST